MASLAEIRARLAAADNKQGNQTSGGDNAIYPHWNMNEGDSATLRFLPDADNSNTFFWIERAMIKLPFNGIKGQMDSKSVQVQVPCVEMWGDTCPILTEVRPWFKDSSLEDMGRKYWKKKSYVFQGFVRENPLDEESPENPIRRFIMGPQLFNIIKASLMDPDMEELPTDYSKGIDFRVVKTSKGGYADYSTSNWARKESALTEAEQKAVDSYGLFDLNDFLPKKPNEAELGIIKQMFEDSVDGKAYDAEKFGQYFRPSGVQLPDTGNAKTVAPATAPAETNQTTATETAPVETANTTEAVAETPVETPSVDTSGGQRAEDILAMIRSRQK